MIKRCITSNWLEYWLLFHSRICSISFSPYFSILLWGWGVWFPIDAIFFQRFWPINWAFWYLFANFQVFDQAPQQSCNNKCSTWIFFSNQIYDIGQNFKVAQDLWRKKEAQSDQRFNNYRVFCLFWTIFSTKKNQKKEKSITVKRSDWAHLSS